MKRFVRSLGSADRFVHASDGLRKSWAAWPAEQVFLDAVGCESAVVDPSVDVGLGGEGFRQGLYDPQVRIQDISAQNW